MALVGIFSQLLPEIGGVYFDALLEESSELITDVTEYPIETGKTGNDHAITQPLRVTMTVGLSDNPARVMRGKLRGTGMGALASAGATLLAGQVVSKLSGTGAALAGVAGQSILLGQAAGSDGLASRSALENIRAIQQSHALIDVVGARGTYKNMIITSTRTQATKENEGGLELVVELKQLPTLNTASNDAVIRRNLPAGDTAATQAQPEVNLGQVALR